ncbi:hypothetical protein ABZP36_001209 [Zizania latifolia]
MTCTRVTIEEKALILTTLKFEDFWKQSCYHLEEDAPKKKNEDKEIERYSDRKHKTQAKREALAPYLKLTPANFPAELIQGYRQGQPSNKRLRWDRGSDEQAFEVFEKLEEKGKAGTSSLSFSFSNCYDGDKKADKDGGDEDEQEEEEIEEEENSDDDYNQNIEFDDDDDDWNQEAEAQKIARSISLELLRSAAFPLQGYRRPPHALPIPPPHRITALASGDLSCHDLGEALHPTSAPPWRP